MKYLNIEAERVRKDMTKEEFANILGVSMKTYYNWINTETPIPSTALLKMSKIFGVSVDYLLENSKYREDAVSKDVS